MELDDFTRAYITAALWTSEPEECQRSGEFYERGDYTIDNIAPESLAKMVEDCRKFQEENAEALQAECSRPKRGEWSNDAQAGHDFWLTRNHHGAGFWDGDWPEPEAAQLTKAAKGFRECDLYQGDDGRLYVS